LRYATLNGMEINLYNMMQNIILHTCLLHLFNSYNKLWDTAVSTYLH